jgi:hypothetical protein
MNRNKALLLILLLASFSLAACSGPLTPPCTGNCGGGNATVSFTLVADTLPANPSILSFKVTILSITLTPTTGTAQTFTPNPSIVVDLMRLQSDTAFLGALTRVPSGSYAVQVSLSNPVMTFLNDTGSTITANGVTCLSGFVCTATLSAVGTPTISSFTFNASTGGQQGIEIDFNLNNAISLSGGTLSRLTQPGRLHGLHPAPRQCQSRYESARTHRGLHRRRQHQRQHCNDYLAHPRSARYHQLFDLVL